MSENIGVRLTGDISDLRRALGQGGQEVRSFAQGAAKDLRGMGEAGAAGAKQIEWATRNIPAQMTDIWVSLASGQKPLTVLMQQGGQLKDMFGGIGPAARAVGGYIAGLANPVTIGAVAVGALATAAYQGSQELRQFQDAATISGMAATISANQYAQMRDGLVAIAGTRGKAAEALTEIASNAQVADMNIRGIGEAALLMEKATGKAVRVTVQEYAKLAEAPAAASLELNKQYSYLTAGVYAQIKALDEQGQKQRAMELAERSYTDAIKSRASSVVENVGWMEKAWRGLTGVAKGAWDAMMDVGREKTLAEKFAESTYRLNAAQGRDPNRRHQLPWETGEERLRGENRDLFRQLEISDRNAQSAGETAASERAGVAAVEKLTQTTDRYASKQEQLNKALKVYRTELDALRNSPSAATSPEARALLDPKAIAATEAAIRKSFADTSGESSVAGARAAKRIADEEAARLKAAIANQDFTSPLKLTQGEQRVIQIQEQLRENILGVARANKERELAEARREVQSEKSRVLDERQYEAAKRAKEMLDRQVESAGSDADKLRERAEQQEAANAVFGKGRIAVEELTLAQLKLQAAEAHDSSTFDKRYVAALDEKVKAQTRYLDAVKKAESKAFEQKNVDLHRANQDDAAMLQLELDLVGQTQEARDRILAQRRVELEYAKKIQEVDRSELDPADKERRRAEIRAEEVVAKANAANRSVLNEWQRTADSINGSLTDALMRGFEAGKDFASNLRDTVSNMFRSMVLRPVVQAIVSPIGGMVSSGISAVTSSLVGSATGPMTSMAASALGSLGGSALTASLGSGLFSTAGAYAAAVPGLTSAAAGSQAAMLAAQTAEFGAAGLTSTAAAGGSAVAGTLGAALPWVGAALAIGMLLSKKRGGPKVDGRYGDLYSVIGTAENQELAPKMKDLVSSMETSYKSLTDGLGLPAMSFGAGLSTDPKGTSASFLELSATAGGRRLAGFETTAAPRDSEALQQFIADHVTQVMFEALSASDLPDRLKAYLGAGGSTEEMKAGLDRLTAARKLEEQVVELQGTASDNLARAREKELAAADEMLRPLLEQVHQQQTLLAQRELEDRLLALTGTQSEQLARSRQKEMDATEAALHPLLRHIYAQEDLARALQRTSEEAQSLANATRSETDAALADLEKLIGTQRTAAEAMRQTAQEAVDQTRSLLDLIAENIRGLYGEVDSTMVASAVQGQQFIVQALATARSTGYLPDQAQLASAVEAARAAIRDDRYATAFDAARARLVLGGQLEQLRGFTATALAKAQTKLSESESAVDGWDRMIEEARSQVSAVRGVDQSVRNVGDLIQQLQTALVAEIRASGNLIGSIVASLRGGSLSAPAAQQQLKAAGAKLTADAWNDVGGDRVWVSSAGAAALMLESGATQIYGKNGDRFTALEARDYANAQLAGGNVSGLYDKLQEVGISAASFDALMGYAPGTSNSAAAAAGLPAFVGGGDHLGGWRIVGERGPELEYTPPARIFSAPDTQQILGGSDGLARLLGELIDRMERVEVATLNAGLANQEVADVLTGRAGQAVPLLTQAA